MKARTQILAGIIEAAALLVAVYFEPACCVRGHLHGEAFFEGKSTSWWRQELDRWDVTSEITLNWRGWEELQFRRNARWFEQFQDRWHAAKPDRRSDEDIVAEIVCFHQMRRQGPPLLQGDPEAIPVLQELLDDPSPKIRRFARIGLKLDAEER
jgi:hypothetical protein